MFQPPRTASHQTSQNRVKLMVQNRGYNPTILPLPCLNYPLKNGPNSASFCFLSSFAHNNDNFEHILKLNWKRIDVVLGIRTRAAGLKDVGRRWLHLATEAPLTTLLLCALEIKDNLARHVKCQRELYLPVHWKETFWNTSTDNCQNSAIKVLGLLFLQMYYSMYC